MKTPTTTPTPPASARQQTPPSALTQQIAADLDRQRQSGPLNQLTIPPCPQLLLRLRAALAQAEPDLQEVSRVASSDVAMAATLLRNANSARYTAGQPVRTVGQAMNRLGLEVTATVLTEVLLRQTIRADHP
ncbi:MAG: HDOD domain-containing protein, partial [Rubrivivax sp.]